MMLYDMPKRNDLFVCLFSIVYKVIVQLYIICEKRI